MSRRADQGPKTIEQIHKEAKIEEQEEQRKVQQLMTKEKRRPGETEAGLQGCRGQGAGTARQVLRSILQCVTFISFSFFSCDKTLCLWLAWNSRYSLGRPGISPPPASASQTLG